MPWNVDLKEIGITVRNTWVTRTGGILLEVNSSEIANTLTEKMRLAVADKARVAHPERHTSVLLFGVSHWVEEAEVREGLVTAGFILDSGTTVTIKRG